MLFISPPFGNYLTFLPYTTCIQGSYTVNARPGLLSQIYNTLYYSKEHNGWINKIGLRNPGIDYGLIKYKPTNVLSLAILNVEKDINYFNKKIPQTANIEINISCPNESVKFPNEIKNLMHTDRKWCIIKLSPLETEQNIDNLYNMGFRQFHCCNTFPTIFGGLSGPLLIPYVEKKIRYIKNNYNDTEVIAGGGIQNIETINYYKKLGADHFSISTICFNPLRFIWFYIQYINWVHI